MKEPQPSASDTPRDPELDAAIRRGHEYATLQWRTILAVGLSLFLLTIVALLLVAGVLRSHNFSQARGLRATEQWSLQNRDPGVQPNQAYTRQQLDEFTRQQLTSYAWQREDHSVARIPIERAMQILAERKLQAGFETDSETQAGTETDAESTNHKAKSTSNNPPEPGVVP